MSNQHVDGCGGNKAAEADSAADSVTVESISETVNDSVAVVDSVAPAADSAAADSAK